MKTGFKIVFVVVMSILLLSSCISRKKLTYLQYSDNTQKYPSLVQETGSLSAPKAYEIQPYDNLYIRVLTPDPQWSALFNTMPIGAGGAVTEESAGLFGYPVDLSGYIEIPFVGNVKAEGKTLAELTVDLDSLFKGYVTDAAIMVRLVNNFISILGEVNAPGRYHLTKDRMNIFEALSLASDMSVYSNKQKIQLIRPSQYGPVVKEFSLSDRSILSSEYYYLMPNDIIYVMPLQGRAFQVNSIVWTMFFTALSSAFGIIALIRTL